MPQTRDIMLLLIGASIGALLAYGAYKYRAEKMTELAMRLIKKGIVI